ncbi:hypothetical protein LTR94_034465, partial [Friedmanniomyces endolithicus]
MQPGGVMPRGDLGSILLAGGLALCAGAAVAQQRPATPLRAGAGDAASADVRADEIERRMRPEERTVLTHGLWAIPLIPKIRIPSDAVLGAGYIAGIPRLGVPALRETDASLGVSYIANLRNDGATAMP